MSKEKYYLVRISVPQGPDDMIHGQEFQMMMTKQEYEIGKKLQDAHEDGDDDEYEEYDDEHPIWCILDKLCTVTKEEYKKFSPLLHMSYSDQLMSDIHSRFEEQDDRKNKKKGKRDGSGKDEEIYYLVNVNATGWDDEYRTDYEYFLMLTEEELKAAKNLLDEEEDQVVEVCTVTKQEYDKFSKLLKGIFSDQFLREVQEEAEKQEDEEVNKKRRKKHSMTVESEGENNDDDEEECDDEDDDGPRGMVEEDDEEISEGQTAKKIKS